MRPHCRRAPRGDLRDLPAIARQALHRLVSKRLRRPELALDNLRQTQAPAFGQVQGELLIEHIPVEKALIVIQQTLSETGLTHALEHHVHEQRFELPGHLLQARVLQACVLILSCTGFQLGKALKIQIDIGGGASVHSVSRPVRLN